MKFFQNNLLFRQIIVLSPVIYLIHHFEEHIIFNFRDWRLTYFLDNNPLTSEEMLIRLGAFLLIIIFVHQIKQNRASALLVLYFLMTTQVVNAFFHVFFSFYFADFSPGAITGVLLYLPVNYLIYKAAINAGYIKNNVEILILFILGATTFALFEAFGPTVTAVSIFLYPVFYFLLKAKEA